MLPFSLQEGIGKMEELDKRMDAAEKQIQDLHEALNRRFDQLAEMIRNHIPAASR